MLKHLVLAVVLSLSLGSQVASATTVEQKLAALNDISLPANEPLYVVAHVADDCPWCRMWVNPFGGRRDLTVWMKTHANTSLLIVSRGFEGTPEKADEYSAELQWLFNEHQAKDELLPPTPEFEVVSGGAVLVRGVGLDSWKDYIFPAVQKLDEQRQK